MGWLKLARRPKTQQDLPNPNISNKAVIEHIEYVDGNAGPYPKTSNLSLSPTKRPYHFVCEEVPDEDLPFIPAAEVLARRRTQSGNSALSASDITGDEIRLPGRELWIVVDEVVYDCTEFIEEHPGGEQVISSFIGEDCSWQFWRFHGKGEMQQYGRSLRVGRTSGIKNRFPEPVRYVGLSRIGHNDW